MTAVSQANRGLFSIVRTRLRALPPGTVAVMAGLVSAAVTTYGFLAVTARALGPEAYGTLSVVWSAVFLIAPAVYIPLEQETSRRIAGRVARGEGVGAVARTGARVALGAAVLVIVVLAASAPVSVDEVFDGHEVAVAALAGAAVAFALNHQTRARLSGRGRFVAYGTMVGLDSGLRLVLAVALAVAGVDAVGAYALVIACTPLLSLAIFLRPEHEPGPASDVGGVVRSAAPLVGSQILAQVLVNGGPIAVAVLATASEQEAAGQLLASLVMARIPLFFFQAVQASLLPRLASFVATGDLARFDDMTRRLGLGVLVLTALGVSGAAAIGPTAVRLAFGSEYALGRQDLTLLALGSCTYMLAVVGQQALLALERHRYLTPAWLLGLVAAVSTLAVFDDLLLRVELALVAGMFAATAVVWAILVRERLDPGRLAGVSFPEGSRT